MSKALGSQPLLVAITGTAWIAALVVAYFVAGFTIESDAFWCFGTMFVMILGIAPFALFSVAKAAL